MITPGEPLQQCYLALGYLEKRKQELETLLTAFCAHELNYPALYTRGEAAKWVEEGQRLMLRAEQLQKEEKVV